jgi:hypothetical protein
MKSGQLVPDNRLDKPANLDVIDVPISMIEDETLHQTKIKNGIDKSKHFKKAKYDGFTSMIEDKQVTTGPPRAFAPSSERLRNNGVNNAVNNGVVDGIVVNNGVNNEVNQQQGEISKENKFFIEYSNTDLLYRFMVHVSGNTKMDMITIYKDKDPSECHYELREVIYFIKRKLYYLIKFEQTNLEYEKRQLERINNNVNESESDSDDINNNNNELIYQKRILIDKMEENIEKLEKMFYAEYIDQQWLTQNHKINYDLSKDELKDIPYMNLPKVLPSVIANTYIVSNVLSAMEEARVFLNRRMIKELTKDELIENDLYWRIYANLTSIYIRNNDFQSGDHVYTQSSLREHKKRMLAVLQETISFLKRNHLYKTATQDTYENPTLSMTKYYLY